MLQDLLNSINSSPKVLVFMRSLGIIHQISHNFAAVYMLFV